jgi:hypothetical protein
VGEGGMSEQKKEKRHYRFWRRMILKKDSFFEISFLKEMCFDVY